MGSSLFRVSRRRLAASILAFVFGATAARGDISGFVRVEGSGNPGTPIQGARVHVRADSSVVAVTGADGSFTLAVNPAGPVQLAASIPYNRAAATNYLIGGEFASNGDTGVDIRLDILPAANNPSYEPPAADVCGSCHASVYPLWAGSNHADAARNEWVLDLFAGSGTPGGGAGYVFRDTHDAGETGFCATCHAPMEDVFNPGQTMLDEVSTPAGSDGVNCVTCHQMDSVDENNLDALHFLGKSTYRFPDNSTASTADYVWAPLDDVTFPAMKVSHSTLHRTSLVCAACHQYNNPTTGAPGQNTYREWAASPFAAPGPSQRNCQDCHMPPATDENALCIFVAEDRPANQRRRHVFIGSTPDMLQNNLALTVAAQEIPGRVRVVAQVENFGAGHSFPTGVSIRNAILLVSATLNGQPLTQAGGPTVPFWGSDDVPGEQPGDYAGFPGKGFAKILEGRINEQGPTVRPVLFIDAEGVFSNTLIPSGATDTTTIEFQLPPGVSPGASVAVEARLLYRRAFRATQVTKGWTQSAHGGPVEIEVAREESNLTLTGTSSVVEVPALSPVSLIVLGLALATFGAYRLRRRQP
ncbi:MAG TPA: IPTL-CTERM sorting domain-containing protein [Thermoanaerobaculia bacterium]|nr:IPTL-CTERM sorting domain-containing protein [Thermoanaerobaculia bacterium]